MEEMNGDTTAEEKLNLEIEEKIAGKTESEKVAFKMGWLFAQNRAQKMVHELRWPKAREGCEDLPDAKKRAVVASTAGTLAEPLAEPLQGVDETLAEKRAAAEQKAAQDYASAKERALKWGFAHFDARVMEEALSSSSGVCCEECARDASG